MRHTMKPRVRARATLAALALAAVAACDPNEVQQVTENDVVRIQVTPDSLLLPIGESAQLIAHALDASGALLSGVPMTWQAGDPGVASVTDGLVTGNAVGTTQIGVRAADVTASITVRVDLPPEISLDVDSVGFAKGAGEADPSAATVNVANIGAFPLEGLTVDTITYGAGAADWLMATLDQSTAPAVLTLSPMTSAVTTAGTYTAEIQLSGTGAQNSPTTVMATLVITGGAAAMAVANDGDGQTAAVNTAVATAPSVLITDAFGNAVAGVDAVFAVTGGGGSVTGGTATSDANGVARVGSWTLGDATGPNMLEATVGSFTPIQFMATAVAGAPARIEISAGDGQTAVAGADVTVPPAVTVFDAFDNGVPGATVSFTVGSGGGSVSGSPATSDANGLATVGSWTMGSTAGANTLIATAAGVSDTLTFNATSIAGAAANIALSAGGAQTDTVGATLATPYAVLVTDTNGNPVAGVNVTWAVTAGGGSIPGVSASDASGIAIATHTFGTTAGAQSATASATGLSGSPISFTSTATAGAAALVAVNDGDGQMAAILSAVAIAPSVLVTDAFGNPVAGATATFAVAGGGGSVTGASATSDASGIARVGSWTLGGTVGPNLLDATVGALAPVQFTATALAGAPSRIEITAGNGQTAVAGAAVTVAPAVTVFDAEDNGVEGVAVTFTVTAGGGSVSGSPATSDTNGLATVGSWTLGPTAGPNTLIATAGGVTDTLTFNATGIAGAAANIALSSGDAQVDTVGATLATPYAVLVTDANGNAVSGVNVTWAVTAGGGSIPGVSATDASGIATATHTFGASAGAQTVTASSAGLSGSPVTFTSTATVGAPSSMAAAGGDAQTATVNTAVATAPSVLVTDDDSNPISGVIVTFAVTGGGGSVTGGSAVTNGSGIAQVGSWTLGTAAGANELTASLGALTPVVFTATGTAGAATNLQLNAGDGQSAVAGNPVSTPPSVLVVDAFGNPVQGTTVNFGNVTGGGSLSGASPSSGADGVATLGSWTLGATAGANSVDATSTGLPETITFNATGIGGAADSMFVVSGDAQTDTVGATLATPYTVRVVDTNSNGVPGIPVTWTATVGGGSLTNETVTDASGFATATHVLGTTAGAQVVTAALGGVSGSPLTFTSTATAGAPVSAAVNAGDGQTATVDTDVAVDPSIVVQDQFGNGVGGVSVTFAATDGSSSITGAAQVTNASGIATVGSWRLRQTAGTSNNTLSATPTGLSAVNFTASGTADVPAALSIDAGDGQSATAGSPVALAPRVEVLDQFGNPTPGITVTFSVSGGGGSTTGATPTTNASGLASVGSWTLGATAGANSLDASVSGIGSPVTFNATGTAGAAANIALSGGNAQSDTIDATLSTPYTVLVTDANANPVSGVTVTWAVTGGGGSITSSSATNGSGIASATRVLGTIGSNTATASVGGLSGSPVNFTATATAGAAASMVISTGNSQTATVNTNVAIDPRVLVRDRESNPVSGVSVTFAATLGGGSVTGGSQTTNASGLATVTSWRLGTAVGTSNNRLTASSTGLTSVNFFASATAGAPTQLSIDAGDGQSATAGSPVAVAPRVEVLDQFGNPTPGITVTFAVSGGGGSTTGATPTTNASGLASVGSWTLGATAGANSLNASVSGIGSPVTFNATGTVGAAAIISLNGGNAQSDTIDATLSTPYTVLVTDANANPVSGVTVTWAVTGGSGSITSSSATNGSGIASATRVLGVLGSNTATASVGGLSGSPVNFSATATVGAPNSMVISTGNNQTATVNTFVSTDPRVLIRDREFNPVSGVSVTFSATLGGGSVTGGSQSTNSSGLATVTAWRLGTTAGTSNNRLTASSSGLTSVNFFASATAGTATSIIRVSGNNQTAERGDQVTNDPTVRVRDAFGNNVSGVLVTFDASGSGSQSPTFVFTNSSGQASTNWTVETGGHSAQSSDGTFPNTLSASISGASTSFSADAIYSFTTDVNPIWVAEGCTGCHGTTSGLTLSGSAVANWLELVNVSLTCDGGLSSSYRRVNNGGGNTNANTFSILMRMVDPSLTLIGGCNTRMPDASGISSSRREIIRNWIRNGAPFN